MAVEEEFNIEIPDEEAERLTTCEYCMLIVCYRAAALVDTAFAAGFRSSRLSTSRPIPTARYETDMFLVAVGLLLDYVSR